MELPIHLDPASGLPLHRQVSDALRRAIVDGRLPRGSRVPSTRALAEALGVSRATLTSTFAQLISEGYLRAAVGSGTFVSTDLPDESPGEGGRGGGRGATEFRLSAYGASLARAEPLEPPRLRGTIDFRDGRPAFDRFPYDRWRRCIARHVRDGADTFDYSSDPAGLPRLRAAIAAYLGRARAVACEADDIAIVSGSQQAIDLIARVLIEPGDVVVLEDPGYPGAQRTFAAHGAEVRGVPVDDDGLRVDLLRGQSGTIRLVYVTPSHQFPLGSVLSFPRRLELLRWAEANGTTVVEDDYDSAYRHAGRPIPALHGLDGSGRTLYVGTFSKTMFPALRLGYVVVPRALRGVVAAAKAFSDRQSPTLEQCALADFIEDGSFERHIRRMRVLYGERRAALLDALRRHIGARAQVIGDSAGMHLVVRLQGVDEAWLVPRARSAGVALKSTHPHYLAGATAGEFIFGFAEHTPATLDEGVARLARALAAPPPTTLS
jgi:GntR family transcriptional regulator/MocR family aminotransferase